MLSINEAREGQKQPPESPCTAGCSQQAAQPARLDVQGKKKVNCFFFPSAWGGVIKEAVNQVFKAHLTACRDLVTQIILEHHLMARSHTQGYTHTHTHTEPALQLGSCSTRIVCILLMLKLTFLPGHLW